MRLAHLLNDVRDEPILRLLVKSTALIPLAAWILADRSFPVWLGAAYLALLVGFLLTPMITAYHDVNHHKLFRRRYAVLNNIVNWLVGPLFGFTPHSYFVYHVGMHHPEDNGRADVSTTLPYQRDSVRAFLRYYANFMGSYAGVIRYLRDRQRARLMREFTSGELAYFAFFALAAAWNWRGALVVLAIPLVITRTVLVIGNWGEHAFIDPTAPDDPFRSNLNLVGSRVNDACFNVGYHIGHHLAPMKHFTEMPADFEKNLALYGERDAIVLQDMHYPMVWWNLMTKNYRKLAQAFVRLPGAPVRTEEEIMNLLRARTAPIGAQL
jgi:fatty acid desaturase